MLMAVATNRAGSAHSSSSSISPPPPPPPSWHPLVLVPNHQQALYDPDLATPSPSPTTPAAASPPRHNNHLRPAVRQAGKRRRPRPSRKLPTTYISADAASFRRMVHQVTGAHDALLVPVPGPAAPELLCRPAPAPPSRAGLTTTTTTETLLLPTLDTSAFLMLGAAGGGGAATARPGASFCCHGSADPGAALQVKAEAYGGGEFPSLDLESWDEDDALF